MTGASRSPALSEIVKSQSEPAGHSLPQLSPIVVDLDHTLIKTDSLHEQLVVAFFCSPLGLLGACLSLLRGRKWFKTRLAHLLQSRDLIFPVRHELTEFLKDEREKGREIHLCTGAHQSLADRFARRLNLFTSVAGTDTVNLKGNEKAIFLSKRFPGGYAYAGDSRHDLHVWRKSNSIIMVGVSAATFRKAKALGKPIEATFPGRKPQLKDWIVQLRPHHWTKNLLLFVALILSHTWSSAELTNSIHAFCILCAVTSSTYIINDLADLQSDREHWSKRFRPIASGVIPITYAVPVAVALLLLPLLDAWGLSFDFFVTLCTYIILTLSYTAGLKRVPILDCFVIAVLFTVRVVMGVAIARSLYSGWLFSFSLAIFFSLALAKRSTELLRAASAGQAGIPSRGYKPEDVSLVLSLGISRDSFSSRNVALFNPRCTFARRVQ